MSDYTNSSAAHDDKECCGSGNIYRTVTDAMAYQEAVKYAMDHTS